MIKINNEHGFTITELIAGIVLIGLLAYGFAMGMTTFVRGYQETRDFMRLQQDMMSLMDTIRFGYTTSRLIDRQSDTPGLIGLLTANRIEINTNQNVLTVTPLDSESHGTRMFWSRVSHAPSTGQVLYSAQYRSLFLVNRVIFPTSTARVGLENKYQITQLTFESLNPTGVKTNLVKVTMTGRVRFRQRARGQSIAQDLQQNIRFAQFETTVFATHTDK